MGNCRILGSRLGFVRVGMGGIECGCLLLGFVDFVVCYFDR